MRENIIGNIHSIQSLGTLDGPGVRFVVFLQGCHLRCKCCHNPDTWDFSGGTLYTAREIVQKAVRYKEYFGKEGGITVSGGEPLLQAEFTAELFALCHSEGINTCLDTSGSILNQEVSALLDVTDRVLLDIKYTSDALYRENVGCSISAPLQFLRVLKQKEIPTTLRQVIIPNYNDSMDNISELNKIIKNNPNIDKAELLPFRKLCQTKYDELDIIFPFKEVPEPEQNLIAELQKRIVI